MLMGQLPGGQALPLTNSYSGAQRFASAPLQPYPLPHPVPRPPVTLQPPAPVATLPTVIETWRRQLLAMPPWQLMQQFGMAPAQVRQLLSDPQTATLLFHQTQGDHPGFGSQRNRETSGMGSAPDRAMREADMMRAGYVDNLRDFVGAIRSGIRAVSNPIGTGVASMVENAAGVAPGTYGGISGTAQRFDMDLENAVRSGRINPQTGRAWTRAEAIAQQSRRNAEKARGERNERDRAASRGAGPGGRGPRGGGAYGGMGGVGSHGV
ncbi:MAG TPA: hypothetical protein VMT98_00720 [Verrucomicrobiae bacterium]|nr:hypothetical protein [Verrucomicrobiae bacterium]